jgi:ABC-type branched-subunit amino acid transport system substrate-binding protein
MKRWAVTLLVLVACTGAPKGSDVTIVVNVPLQRAGALATEIANGARLAAEQINAAGGIKLKGSSSRLVIKVLDSDYSPTRTVANVRESLRDGAVAMIDEGTGIDAAWRVARDGGLPVVIVVQGGRSLVDAEARPNVFRIAPTDRGSAYRLAEYMIPKGFKIAVIHDDSTYGIGGRAALDRAFARNRSSLTSIIRVSADASDLSTEVLRVRRQGATAVLLWARPRLVALALRAAGSTGWDVPVFSSTSGSDPLIRQELADHPEWVDGMTFTISRLQSEKGLGIFQAFRDAYEKRFGLQKIGVRSAKGEVVQAPDQAMYAYDAVHVLAAAIERAGVTRTDASVITALNEVEVQGANGDERSFNLKSHEGVVDDDIFFARFDDMIWYPVDDDALSATLMDIRQVA